MRITLVASYYAPVVGGIETHVARLAAKLQERGARVEVVCLARGGGQSIPMATAGGSLRPGNEMLDGILVRRVQSHGFGESLRWPTRLVRFGSCDVAHFHGFSRPLLLRMAYDRPRIPWVITPHSGIYGVYSDPLPVRRLLKSAFDMSIGGRLLSRASRVVALTEFEARYVQEHLNVAPSRVTIVPNALPHEAFKFAPASPGSSDRLLVLSRLASRKRIDDLLVALQLLPSPPGCDIVGPDEGQLAGLKLRAKSFPPGHIRFSGPVFGDAKLRLLRAAKALVLPSSLEGLSITALEAIAQGTPVIASEAAVSGLPEGGFLSFPVGDVQALARCIRSLDDAPFLATVRKRTLAARSTVLSEDQQIDSMLAIYSAANDERQPAGDHSSR